MHKPLNDINDVLRAVLDEVRPKPKATPTPAQINRIIMQKHKAQKKLLRKKKRAAAAELGQDHGSLKIVGSTATS